MKYNGVEVELITEGYWPEGVEMIYGDDLSHMKETATKKVCLRNGIAFDVNGDSSLTFRYWALKPAKPAPRRLTNREVYRLWRSGWDAVNICNEVMEPAYDIQKENEFAPDGTKLRAHDSDEWVEPTSDLLEGCN